LTTFAKYVNMVYLQDMRRIFLVFSFFAVTQALLFISILFLLSISYKQNESSLNAARHQNVAFAALPTIENTIQDQIIFEDARIEIVRQFFERYDSPLEPFAPTVVEAADLYDLDFRLIPAIAMQESNLCKKIPIDSNNCWGFGIYGTKVTVFENYSDAIYAVTRTLALNYIADGLDTPYEIMTRYTPQSNGSWAESVEYFINQLQ
jgi:hypothetical protein